MVQVRAKTFVHLGSEQGNGFRDNANLLANIELGVHSDSPRQTGDDAPTPPVGYPAAKVCCWHPCICLAVLSSSRWVNQGLAHIGPGAAVGPWCTCEHTLAELR